MLTGLPNYPEGRVFPDFVKHPEQFATYANARIVRLPILPRRNGNFRLVLNYLSFVVSGLMLGSWRLRRTRFDVIFVFQTSPITCAIPALWLRWLRGVPVLMWVLDLWPESIAAVGAIKSKFIQRLVGRLVAFIYRRCDRILIQSRAFLANIAQYGGTPEQTCYFPGWAESIFLGHAGGATLAPELAPYTDTFNVLFAGNIGDAQDFPAILDAAEILKPRADIRWIILGDGRASSWVQEEVRRRRLDDAMILIGRQPIERMPSFFRGAHALLVSLRKDPIFALTIPGKVQSYLAAGLPLVGMLDGEGARIIREAEAGLVCPAGAGEELAIRVRSLADMSPVEREHMGIRGRDYCQVHFDREALIGNLEAWILEVIKESSPGGS